VYACSGFNVCFIGHAINPEILYEVIDFGSVDDEQEEIRKFFNVLRDDSKIPRDIGMP
jgi:hypothetical protein